MSVLEEETRVNTARQSKGLPISHYLIIGVILRATYGRGDSDVPPSRLSNDHLERDGSFVRTTGIRQAGCKERSLESLCTHLLLSMAIFLPNFSLKLPRFCRKRERKKEKKKEWTAVEERLKKDLRTSGATY